MLALIYYTRPQIQSFLYSCPPAAHRDHRDYHAPTGLTSPSCLSSIVSCHIQDLGGGGIIRRLISSSVFGWLVGWLCEFVIVFESIRSKM